MNNEVAVALITGIVALARWSSHREHHRTGKDVNEIKCYFNGELEKRLEEAKEQGRQEERDKQKKTKL